MARCTESLAGKKNTHKHFCHASLSVHVVVIFVGPEMTAIYVVRSDLHAVGQKMYPGMSV